MSAVLDGLLGREAERSTSAQRAHRRNALFLRWLRKVEGRPGLRFFSQKEV